MEDLCPKVFVFVVCPGLERNETHIQRETILRRVDESFSQFPKLETRSRSLLLAVPLERRYT